jgi:UDPglucose 6-dehydrogenase
MNIGIIGYGVVGQAVAYSLKDKCKIIKHDPAFDDSVDLETLVFLSDFIFISVPTPMQNVWGGPINTEIIDDIMERISKYINGQGFNPNPIIVIKSTITPSTVENYINKYPNFRLVFSPEYLTDRNPIDDFINGSFMVLGGDIEDTKCIEELFKTYSICKLEKYGHCDAIGASLLKYMENCFLALKVTFINQFFDLYNVSGSSTSWDDLI